MAEKSTGLLKLYFLCKPFPQNCYCCKLKTKKKKKRNVYKSLYGHYLSNTLFQQPQTRRFITTIGRIKQCNLNCFRLSEKLIPFKRNHLELCIENMLGW